MPTKIEYFELIDSRIEDKTADGSISKVDVSQSLKDSFDYTDQELTAFSDEVYDALDTKADLTSTNDALATKASITYVDTEIDNAIDGLYYDAGNYDASLGTFPTTIFDGSPVTKGATFNVSVAGTLGGVSYAQGESFRALVDTPGQTTGNWAKSLYVPLQATEVGLGTVRYATDSEVGSSTGDGVITAGQIPLLPAGTPSLTSGLVETTTSAPYNELEYGINTIDGTGSVRVPNPSGLPIGYVIYTKAGSVYTIRSYDNTAKLSLGGTNSYTSTVGVQTANLTFRLMHLGSGFWQVEYVDGNRLSLNGIFVADQFFTVAVNATTSPLSASTLNSTYPVATYPPGLRVHCRNISGGGLVYERVTLTEWISQLITTVS